MEYECTKCSKTVKVFVKSVPYCKHFKGTQGIWYPMQPKNALETISEANEGKP